MIYIREVSICDLDITYDIETKCFPPSEAASKESIKDRIEYFPNHFFAAQINDRVVGFINGAVSNNEVITDEMYEDVRIHNEQGKYQMVFGLDVLPDYRKTGIAHSLMRKFISAAKSEGREGVVLTCKNELVGFYESMGFKNFGVSKSIHGGVVWYDMKLIF
jgi:ribosomal protein S18 acetylase RimI-like enzyme